MQDETPLGRYRLLELIGDGETGETWRALDTVTQRHVAVTVLPAREVGDPDNPAHAPQSIVFEYPLNWPADQNEPGPKKSRKGRAIALSSAAAVALIVAGVAAKLLIGAGGHEGAPAASSTSGSAVPPSNTGPLTGTFTVHMSAAVLKGGGPATNSEARAYTEAWQLRSACGANGCIATALAGDHYDVTNLVFDNVGGRWLSVALSQIRCGKKTVDEEAWNVIALDPQPDGTILAESTRASVGGCFTRRTATITRTGDTDIARLADPTRLDPRVVSPAEALHGRYDVHTTYASGHNNDANYGVQTDCLRTGDRCMSYFIAADGNTDAAFVFANGVWTLNETYRNTCSSGDKNDFLYTETMTLPQPPQDPIPLLTAHGYENAPPNSRASCTSQAYDETYTRTGD